MGRSKCVRTTSTTTTPKKVMSYSEFNQRIRKTFYYGSSNLCDIEEDMEVSRPLAEYASEFFSEPHKGHSLNRLNAIAASSVHATPCSLIMALIYLDRLNVTDPCYARRITPQELFIVSMMISTKFYAGHDEEIFISDWAEDGNMTEERLKELELEFLNAIEWNIYISNEQFFKKLNAIEKTIARREGIRRGWLTYTELTQLLPTFTLAKFLFNNFAVLAMSYAASVMTLAGAFFLASQIPSPTSLNVTKPQAAGQNDVLQATTNATSGVLMGATDHHLRPTILPVVTTKSTTKANRCNASQLSDDDEHTINALATKCFALNIEVELLKLERQYLEEARLAELRKRQHEITTDSRLKLPGGAHLAQLNDNHDRSRLSKNDQQTNWRALQEEFSNEMASGGGGKQQNSNEQQQQYLTTSTTPTNGDLNDLAGMGKKDNDYTCFTEWHNCSSYELWNILSDAAQRSIVRLPLLWFKFM